MSSIDNNNNISTSNNSNVFALSSNTPVKSKKIFTPNITKHKFKSDTAIKPTLDYVQRNGLNGNGSSGNGSSNDAGREMNDEDEEALLAQINQNISSNTVRTTPKNNSNANNDQQDKKIFLKIKRKIDEEPLTSIVIERPKKKALLDTFKQFSVNDSNGNDVDDDIIHEEDDINNNNKRNKNNRVSSGDNENNKNESISTPLTKTEKSLFTLFTSIDEANLLNNKSKLEKRFEEYKEKGAISSPKILKAKQEKTIKKRNENRYRQIKSNRIAGSNKDEDDNNIIELEKTDELDEIMSGLTKEEERLICNFKPLLVEQLDKKQAETKYVYDYYFLDPAQAQMIDISKIETVVLGPEEDDFYDGLDVTDDDQSTDSENWYVDYPDESSNASGSSLFGENEDDEYDNHDYYNEDGDYEESFYYGDDD